MFCSEPIEVLTIGSYTGELLYSVDCENPRVEFDTNISVIACWHRRYKLGDVQPNKRPDEYIKNDIPKGSVVLNVYMYDHSGIAVSTSPFSCPWDSGQIGLAWISREEGTKQFGRIWRKKARLSIESEIETYNKFLSGDVLDWVVKNSNGDIVDSCSCYYDIDQARNDMVSALGIQQSS